MALITEIIPIQGFETVQKRLGAILFTELSNQMILKGLENEEFFDVFVERSLPYDKGEDTVINVSANSTNYSGQNQAGTQGDTSFFIDLYVNGDSRSDKTGDEDSLDRLNFYIGMIRYIVCSTKYKTLDFPMTGLVGGVYLQQWQKDDNFLKQEASYFRFARLTVSVRVNENQELWSANPLEGMDTIIKINNTEKGYQLIFNN